MFKKNILINLKRFDVATEYGGICKNSDPIDWIKTTIQSIIQSGWGKSKDINLVIFVPDILLKPAIEQITLNPSKDVSSISIGSQSCHYDDVSESGNFGAFTSLSLASAQASVGCKASLIGHCEERRHLGHVINQYTGETDYDVHKATKVVSNIVSREANCALQQNMQAIICIGETAQERGDGDINVQIENAKVSLDAQIVESLSGLDNKKLSNIILAYEPVWAIGPGKTPPDKEYISYISQFIKNTISDHFSVTIPVVYGGGLKYENASMLASIDSLDGGLIALTNFTQPIGFYPEELNKILHQYLNID